MNTRVFTLGLVVVGLLVLSACATRTSRRPVSKQAAWHPEPAQVFIDTRVVRIPEAHVTAALGELKPTSAKRIHDLDADRAEALFAAWQKHEDIRIIQAPKVLAVHNQHASIWIGETVNYGITSATENESGGLTFSLDDAGSIEIGERMEITPRVVGDRIEMRLYRKSSELKPSFETLDQTEAARLSQAGELEAKHMKVNEIDAWFQVDDGGWVLLGNPEWVEDEDGLALHVIVLSAVILDPR